MTKKILSISGGGIRGAIVSQILKRLEECLPKSLYDTFDMFAGTSTGSLIIASIAYEKMTGEKITNELYNHKNSQKIMNKTLIDKIAGTTQLKPKYNNNGLQKVINSFIPYKTRINDTDKDVLITTFDVDKYKPLIFKSFNKKHNIILKDALCMSSAAPAYFPTYYNKDENIYGIDGGIYSNNPTDCAYAEALKLYGKNEDIRILSIETGYNYKQGLGKKSKSFGGIEWMTQGDLINIIFKASQKSVDYKMKTFTEVLEHKYLYINGLVENDSMDDVSYENLEKLKIIGDEWFDKYKNQIIELLK